MKQKRIGRIVFWVILLLIVLAVGGYFAATRYLGVEIPAFMQPVEDAIAGVFGEKNEETVYVQSVANILGVGYTGKSNRYSGVVEAKEIIEINPDSNLTIEKRYVEAGDTVSAGMPLFSYDVDSLQLSYEQLLIDITGQENTIQSATEEIASLETRIARARENQKYALRLQLQEVTLNKKKAEYELVSKREQAEQLEKAIADSVVTSPVSGKVRSVRSEDSSNPFGGYGQETSNAYITIVAGSDYCVKGTVNEQTVHTLSVGMPVTVRSRVDANVFYPGEIYKINTDEPVQENGGGYYYDGGSGDRSSKYAFYVSVGSIDGLIMGQHVYIELGEPSEDDGKLWLPSYYLMMQDGGASVWARNGKGRIERRTVQLGAYREETDSYEIVSGLGFTDRIAFPDETIHEGMPASETTYAGEGDVAAPDMPDPFGGDLEQEYSFGEILPDDGEMPEPYDAMYDPPVDQNAYPGIEPLTDDVPEAMPDALPDDAAPEADGGVQ